MSDIHAALAALLIEDATFTAALEALSLGAQNTAEVPQVIEGNQPFTSLGQDRLPAWVMEIGDAVPVALNDDADGDGLSIGSRQQSFQTEILLALVWHQQSPATAFAQRKGLLAPVVSLLLRNVVDGTVNCWVERFDNDRQANHPTHVARFTVLATQIFTR